MSAPDDRRSIGAPLVGRDATVDGGTAALLVAAAAALLMGAASGSLAGMAAGVGGAVATVVGVIRVADTDPVSRGVGSVALVVGAVFAIRGLAVSGGGPGFLLVVCGSIGVLAIAVETLPGGRVPPLRPALYSLFGSAGVLLVTGVAFLGLTPLLENVEVVSGLFSARGGRFANVLPSILVLQVLIVVLSRSIERARDVLRRWIPDKRTDRFSVLARLGVEAGNIPRELWAFLGVQVILVLLLPGVVTDVLRETAPGEALYVLLTGGALHLLVLALILPFAGVIGVEAVRHLVVRVSGYHPPTVIGLLAGGLVATMGSFVLAVLGGLGVDVTWVTEAVSPLEVIGLPGGGAILSIAVGVAVFSVALKTGGLFARRVIGPHITGVLGGTTLLFVTAVIGSEMGVHPVVVFVTVGLGLAALEAGSRSSRLSRRLGPSVDARSAELVHLLGSTIAIGVGVGLATATLYLVVPVAVGLGNTRAIMLLIAGLMGLFAAVFLFGRESSAVSR